MKQKTEEQQLLKAITRYWEVKPPYKENKALKSGTLEWHREISKNRNLLVPYLTEWLESDRYRGKRVLEIGCGGGADLAEYARSGAEVTGIDITDHAVKLTGERLKLEGLMGKVEKYDGRVIPYENETYDLVFSQGVLHHTPYMEDLLSEIHRVLKKNGQFKMMVYNKKSLLYYYSILYLRRYKGHLNHQSREEVLSYYSEFRENCPHTRCYYENELKEMLWLFDRVDISADYVVYDTEEERKRLGGEEMKVQKTGTPDIDRFFIDYNRDVREGKDLRKYGWHLLAHAYKGVMVEEGVG